MVTTMIEVPGATPEKYRELTQRLGVGADAPPDGLIFHTASKTEDGLLIFNIWESEENFRRFSERVMPMMSEMGMRAQPRILETINLVRGKAAIPSATLR